MVPGPIDADVVVESHEDPHANLDDGERDKQDDELPKEPAEEEKEVKSRAARRLMIHSKGHRHVR